MVMESVIVIQKQTKNSNNNNVDMKKKWNEVHITPHETLCYAHDIHSNIHVAVVTIGAVTSPLSLSLSCFVFHIFSIVSCMIFIENANNLANKYRKKQ